MAKRCQVTYKKPMQGNNVSHSHRKTRRRFMPNLQKHRFWIKNEKRYIKLHISTKGMRIIDKYGIEKYWRIGSEKENKVSFHKRYRS